MQRKSRVTTPTKIDIIFIPNQEKVQEAQKLAALGYKRALLNKLKQPQHTDANKPSA